MEACHDGFPYQWETGQRHRWIHLRGIRKEMLSAVQRIFSYVLHLIFPTYYHVVETTMGPF